MKTYRIEYRIDVDATSPEAAAEIANTLCMEQPERCWTVIVETGDEYNVWVNAETGCCIDDEPAEANL